MKQFRTYYYYHDLCTIESLFNFLYKIGMAKVSIAEGVSYVPGERRYYIEAIRPRDSFTGRSEFFVVI